MEDPCPTARLNTTAAGQDLPERIGAAAPSPCFVPETPLLRVPLAAQPMPNLGLTKLVRLSAPNLTDRPFPANAACCAASGSERPDLDITKRTSLDGLGCPVRPNPHGRRLDHRCDPLRGRGSGLEVGLLQQPGRSQDDAWRSSRMGVLGERYLAWPSARPLGRGDRLDGNGRDLPRPSGLAPHRSSVGRNRQRFRAATPTEASVSSPAAG